MDGMDERVGRESSENPEYDTASFPCFFERPALLWFALLCSDCCSALEGLQLHHQVKNVIKAFSSKILNTWNWVFAWTGKCKNLYLIQSGPEIGKGMERNWGKEWEEQRQLREKGVSQGEPFSWTIFLDQGCLMCNTITSINSTIFEDFVIED